MGLVDEFKVVLRQLIRRNNNREITPERHRQVEELMANGVVWNDVYEADKQSIDGDIDTLMTFRSNVGDPDNLATKTSEGNLNLNHNNIQVNSEGFGSMESGLGSYIQGGNSSIDISTNNGVYLSAKNEDNQTRTQIVLSRTSAFFRDFRETKTGLSEYEDYSADYTDLSYVNKKFVDELATELDTKKVDKGEIFTLPSKVRPDVILFGTSLEAQNGIGSDVTDNTQNGAQGRGYLNWANAYLNQRLRIVANSGVGGERYDQMLSRIQASVIDIESDWVFIGGPANDIIQNRATNLVIDDLNAMLDIIIADDRKVFLLTAPPIVGATSGQITAIDTFNAYALSLHGTRGIVVIDIFSETANPITYEPRTGMVIDSIHYSESGAHRIGRKIAAILLSNLPSLSTMLINSMDRRSVIANELFNTGTGWTTQAGSGTLSAAYSHNRAILTMSGYAENALPNINYLENISGGRFAIGDVVQLQVKVKWYNLVAVTGTSGIRPYIGLWLRNVDNSWHQQKYGMFVASSENRIPAEVPPNGEVVMKTSPYTIGENVNRLYVYLGFTGHQSVVVEFSDLIVTKV